MPSSAMYFSKGAPIHMAMSPKAAMTGGFTYDFGVPDDAKMNYLRDTYGGYAGGFGHAEANAPWPVGIRARIDGDAGEITWSGPAVEVAEVA